MNFPRLLFAQAKSAGIRNILALRGDAARGSEQWEQCDGGFEHAVDLVRFIRKVRAAQHSTA
jgi:methylenetetrahydrofolate reductase (NADPH)